jgi:hypothetical protein
VLLQSVRPWLALGRPDVVSIVSRSRQPAGNIPSPDQLHQSRWLQHSRRAYRQTYYGSGGSLLGDGLQSSMIMRCFARPSVGVRLLFTSASARWRQRLLPRGATASTKSLGSEFVFVIVASLIFWHGHRLLSIPRINFHWQHWATRNAWLYQS